MRVKRWLLLALTSTGLIVVALLCAFGIDLVRAVYRSVPVSGWMRIGLTALLLAVGVAGFGFALSRLVRSVARGVAPGSREKASTLIYRTRVLERGPRVVAVGGGTGLSTLLRGLKEMTSNITAVVTVMDDGGSSGRLRHDVGMLPPGDVRNCIIALAEDETRLSDLLQHRFDRPSNLAGHSLGNLLLAGLEQATGGFDRAVEAMSDLLSIRGQVLPATLTKTHLVATMDDGDRVEGESRIVADPRRIRRIALTCDRVPAYDRVLEEIAAADLILLGPGSLFTSLIPNLLVEGVAAAIEDAPAEKVLIANLMTQPGETDSFTLRDHLRTLDEYVALRRFDLLLANSARPSTEFVARYRDEAAEPIVDDLQADDGFGLTVVRDDLLGTAEWGGKQTVKHSPKKLVRALAKHTRAFSERPRASRN